MKLLTKTGDEMIQVRTVEAAQEGVVMDVTVMRSMQMSVVLTPAELRKGLSMLSFSLIWGVIRMLFRRQSKTAQAA